nr:polysaccharide biosynthesis C-terminal domain-containing protein [Lactiplantibacillus carotarum]
MSELTITAYQLWRVRHQIEVGRLFTGSWKYWLAGMIMMGSVGLVEWLSPANLVMLGLEIMIGILVYAGMLWLTRAAALTSLLARWHGRRA